MAEAPKNKPIKRHKAIQPLSREHHQGLLLCWKIGKGFEKGIERGVEQGVEKGRIEVLKNIIARMIDDGKDFNEISATTGLSIAEIGELSRIKN